MLKAFLGNIDLKLCLLFSIVPYFCNSQPKQKTLGMAINILKQKENITIPANGKYFYSRK